MALREINKEALKLIDFFEPPVQNAIKTCVQKYSAPKTFSEAIVYLLDRIRNGVKAIFGRSDWQIGEKAIKNALTPKFLLRSILPQEGNLRKNIVTQMLHPQRAPSSPVASGMVKEGSGSTKILHPLGALPSRVASGKKKEEIGSKILQEIIDENNKSGAERVEESLDEKAPKGILAELVAHKEMFAFQQEMGGLLGPIIQEMGGLSAEEARKQLEELPAEERPERLAFLAICGIDAALFKELAAKYGPAQ
jgi:hypothetical protein